MTRYRGRHRRPTHTGRNLAAISTSGAFAVPLMVGTAGPASAAPNWGPLINCESGGDPRAQNASSSASGLFQFIDSTWEAYGGSTARAKDASVAEQYRVANRAFAAEGYGPWAASNGCHGLIGKEGSSSTKTEARIKDPGTSQAAPAPTTKKKRAKPQAPSGVTGKRAADGSGSYVCASDKLYFDACDPDTLGQVVNYPPYSGKHRAASPAKTATASSIANLAQVPAPTSRAGLVVLAARGYIGTPYQWGGQDRSGMDCSGLVYRVLRDMDFSPPRTARAQAAWTTPVSAANARPGDLVYFYSPVSHIGIYLGNGKMLDSSQPGTTVSVHSVYPGASYGRIPT